MNRLVPIFFLFLGLGLYSHGQTKIKLLKADYSKYDVNIAPDAQRLIGHVKFSHEGTIMYCDSAWLFETSNNVEAYGNIKILRGDSLRLTGDELVYTGKNKTAEITGDISLQDRDMTLTTEYLVFDIPNHAASYTSGGEIVSRENNNVLTSQIGTYFTDSEIFHFKKDVELINPDYLIDTDTLHFHQYNGTAYFLGPSEIRGKDNFIYCENGFYDTENDLARFGKNAFVWYEHQKLSGDSLFYNRNQGIGIARENVVIEDTVSDYFIKGLIGKHNEFTDLSYVTGDAEYIQLFEDDTLFLHSDTLKAQPDSMGFNTIKCFYGVKFFKNDMQGICDSLIYLESDSSFYMYDEPLLWSDANQISGNFIKMKTNEGKIETMWIDKEALIISEVDTSHYNQIKGREMVGYFLNNELHKIDISGNGQLIYFPIEENEEANSIIGLNKADCSDIQIRIKDRLITHVNLQNETDSKFLPLDMANSEDFFFKDFKWELEKRPTDRNSIFE